jgi:enhancing lycopene biosynthesis protein 2
MSAKVGVLLSGCGVFDGSEIHEAVSILIALDRRGAQVTCMAPNVQQDEVINHLTNKPEKGQKRNVLEESARIARGKIRDLATVNPNELDALLLPGGFGAAKNLCDFAGRGAEMKVIPQVERLLKEMHAARKPIGFACISPVIAAAVFGRMNSRPRLTIGSDAATAEAINKMGGEHHNVGWTEVQVDEENRLVSTPCYMNDVGPWVVYQGAERMVEEILRMTGDPASVMRGHLATADVAK